MAKKLSDAMKEGAQMLLPLLRDRDQAWIEAETLMGAAHGKDRAWAVAHGNETISPARLRRYRALIKRRLKREPMAYLVGESEFMGRRFRVDKRALIPRPETEELVQLALRSIRNAQSAIRNLVLLDMGVGSGAIAVTLKAELPDATVFASDVSSQALALAKQNTRRILGNTREITFVKANLLSPHLASLLTYQPTHLPASSLVILANLPYLPLRDKPTVPPEVSRYEPRRALFVKGDGTALIKKLLRQLSDVRTNVGTSLNIYLEFDPPQAKTLYETAARLFPDGEVRVLLDSCDRERFLEITATNLRTSGRRSSPGSMSARA